MLKVRIEAGQLVFNSSELTGDPVLLSLQEIEWNCSGVVNLEQFLVLGAKLNTLAFQLFSLSRGIWKRLTELAPPPPRHLFFWVYANELKNQKEDT